MNIPDTVKLDPMKGIPDGVPVVWSNMGLIHGIEKEFGYVFFCYMGIGIQDGWLKAIPRKVVASGLDGVARALRDMRDGLNSAIKYVVRFGDTESIAGH